MTKLEALKLANILMNYYKMPVARRGVFDSYVVTDKDDKDLLYIAAGPVGLYIDIETVEVVKTAKRRNFIVEEEFNPKQDLRVVSEEYED